MFKTFFKISFFAFIIFGFTQFIMILFQIYWFSLVKETPEMRIGTPINFYIFSPNDEMYYKTYLEWKYFLYDYIIFWIITCIYFQFNKNCKLLNYFKQHKTKLNNE